MYLRICDTDTSLKFSTSKTEIKVMPEASAHIIDEFEIGKEDMEVYLSNKAFDEGVLDE